MPSLELITMQNGNVAVSWSIDTIINNNYDLFNYRKYVACLDQYSGDTLWSVFFNDVDRRSVSGLRIAANGDIIGVGSNTGDGKGWLFRISADGILKWERNYDNPHVPDGQEGYLLYDVTETPDGGIAATGRVRHLNAQGQDELDVWLLKVDSMGCLIPGCTGYDVDVGESGVGIATLPEVTDEIRIFPNPATSEAILHYQLPNPHKSAK